jgi:hypothetical protein
MVTLSSCIATLGSGVVSVGVEVGSIEGVGVQPGVDVTLGVCVAVGEGVTVGEGMIVNVGVRSGVRVGTSAGLGKTGGVGVSITARFVAAGGLGSGLGEMTTQDATPKSNAAKMLRM